MLEKKSDGNDRAGEPASNPSSSLPLCGLTNVHAWDDPKWMEFFDELGSYSYEAHIFGSREPPNI